MTHLFVKFCVQPVLNRPRYDETVGREVGGVFPTTAFDRLNVGTDCVSSSKELIRMGTPQFGHEVLDRLGPCVQRCEGGVSL